MSRGQSAPGVLDARSRVLQAIRGYFTSNSYIEVETPLRVPAPALELHIDAVPCGGAFLRTSPELYMKRLLARGLDRIFEMGPCFRDGERGRLHEPEYTMLEWYQTGIDYNAMINVTQSLLLRILQEVLGRHWLERCGRRIELDAPWHQITVSDAFTQFAGWDPVRDFDEDRFDLDLVEKVEPRLPVDRPVVLRDFPAPLAALAKCSDEMPPMAERWELYIGGIELANAYTELTDAEEQRKRFEACREKRTVLNKPDYGIDEEFLSALTEGLPECAGVALGVDRLVMLLTDAAHIEQVRAFCY
jgi:lysyl-tRNA synthetase class 2